MTSREQLCQMEKFEANRNKRPQANNNTMPLGNREDMSYLSGGDEINFDANQPILRVLKADSLKEILRQENIIYVTMLGLGT